MSAMRHRQRRIDQRRRARPAALNLVSLMDIFTILVFFLMVNASEVEVLPPTPGIRLPDSTAEQRPVEQVVISVSRESIVVDGAQVAVIAELPETAGAVIEPLQAALRARQPAADATGTESLQVTIIGDHEIPYWLLKRIMHTCQSAEFPHISLAVNQVGEREA
jgi:biopolymer transport protein ExbD